MDPVRARRSAVAVTVGVAALGLAAGTAALRGAEREGDRGPALKIAVVTPPAPRIQPGEVMEVGELTDGYVHRPAPRPDPIDWVEFEPVVWDEPATTYVSRPARTEADDDRPLPVEPPAVPPSDRLGLGFEPVAEAGRRIRPPVPRTPPVPEAAPVVVVAGERTALFY